MSHMLPTSPSTRPPLQEFGVRALYRLRWVATASQLATLAIARLVFDVRLPYFAMLGLVAAAALSNALLPILARRWPGRGGDRAVDRCRRSDGTAGLVRRPANPFSVFFLVQVLVTAILANRWQTWTVAAASSLGFGLLFFFSVPLPSALGGGHAHGQHGSNYAFHLQGMWLAHTLVAASIATVVSRLSTSLKREREERNRTDQLLGLATLAAGAAHEIGNPLGTIRVVATELLQHASINADTELKTDIQLVNEEVMRAHNVLARMSLGAGELTGEPLQPLKLRPLLEEIISRTNQHTAGAVRLKVGADLPEVRWPPEAVYQAIGGLLQNALQARSRSPVVLSAKVTVPTRRPHNWR